MCIFLGYDHIIRQHKAACLRVTSLLSCKDLLWIGTSAGVVLTMSLPNVTPTTGKMTRMPTISGVPHGNTGQVRILAALGKPLVFSRYLYSMSYYISTTY